MSNIVSSALGRSGGNPLDITSAAGSDGASNSGSIYASSVGSAAKNGLSGLQSVSTLGSMLAQLGQAREKKLAYFSAAEDARLNAQQAIVSGEGQVASLKDQLKRTLGQNDVNYAAGGVDVGDGVARDTRASQTSDEVAAEGVTKLSAKMRQSRAMIDAYRYEMQGRDAARGGILGSFGTLFDTAAKIAKAG